MTSAAAAFTKEQDDGAIADRIVAAVMARKLPAGAKLSEIALCEAFGIGRARVRRVLAMLAERGVATLHANRGAFVRSPGADEARDVFAARRAVERAVALAAAEFADDGAVKRLRAILEEGSRAERSGDRGEEIRLSGLFHLEIAAIAGNSVLSKFLAELVARTSLIIGLHGARGSENCSGDEHGALIDALEAHDGARAAGLMEAHLRHIEGTLDMRERAKTDVDVRALFAD